MLHYSLKIGFSWVVVALLTTCVEGQNLRADGSRDLQAAPAIAQDPFGRNYVVDSYVVGLQRDGGDVTMKAQGLVQAFGGQIEHVYDTVLNGFAAYLPGNAAEALQKNPNVAFIEKNYLVSAIYVDSAPQSWGLDRVDQCLLPRNVRVDTGTLGTTYNDVSGGYAYIVDTGVNGGHVEFNSRVDGTCSKNFMDEDVNNWNDGNGHGTHVAGTMCGKTYGVARNCRKICAVRVLGNDGSGSMSGVIAGVNFVAANAPPGSVANMSLGGGKYDPLNTAIADAVAKGVVFAVAAGNDAQDACNYSPASTAVAITVGATDSNDWRATFSNFGNCVDMFAPGTSIKSAWIGSTTASNTISGTSMATPHVAGLAMLYREQNPNMTPAEIRDRMLSRSSKNRVQSSSSTNAHLAVVPTLKCGPCNEDGVCQVGETSALCPFENCGVPTTCKTTGFACTASSQCCSRNCNKRKKTCA